jgi:hypothetical protein
MWLLSGRVSSLISLICQILGNSRALSDIAALLSWDIDHFLFPLLFENLSFLDSP